MTTSTELARAIPTSLSTPEQRALTQWCAGRRVIEAGALLGFSTLLLESVAALVWSIDRHDGYGPSTLHAYHSNLARFGRGRIRPVVGDARALVGRCVGEVAFVDLTGEFGLTRDVLRALPSTVAIAAVHDVGRNGCPDLPRAIAAAGWRIESVVDTLALVCRAH